MRPYDEWDGGKVGARNIKISETINRTVSLFSFSSFTSLIDSVEFTCKDWTDPEKIGISAYVLYSTNLGTNVKIKKSKKVYNFPLMTFRSLNPC